MKDLEVIAKLTRKNLELEEEVARLRKAFENEEKEHTRLKHYFRDIAVELEYDGHPGNYAGVIANRLGK